MSKKVVQQGGAHTHIVVAAVASAIALAGIGVAVGLLSQRQPGTDTPRVLPSPIAAAPAPVAQQEIDSPSRAPDEPEMRVRIFTGIEAIRVNSTGGVLIGQGDPRGKQAMTPGAQTDRRGIAAGVAVMLRAGQWEVSELSLPGASPSSTPAATYPAGASLVLQPSGGPNQLLAINGNLYAGLVRLTARGESAFDVVEFVGIESYLPGVVAKEMLAGWPLAAYQAQAVAARSYALHERSRSLAAGQPFDVEATDRDQAYAGATTSRPVREAVRSTRGMVLMDGDRILRAYFSSTCGGRTAGARDSWPTGPGYEFNLAGPLQAHPRESACENSPLFRWTIERPRIELAQRLRLYGERNQLGVRRLKDLRAIETVSINGDGRPTRFKIIDAAGGSYQLSAEDMRLACNTGGPAGSAAVLPAPLAVPVLGMPEVTATAERPPMLPDITRSSRVVSSDMQIAIIGERAVITGRGFGHGVGLCQYCAKGFAERGDGWRAMIERFYPGARIDTLY